MFKRIQSTIINSFRQGNPIYYFLGFLIGIGGFAEATVVGMGIYSLIVFFRPPKNHNLLLWSKDIVVVAIGILLLVYWSYIEPQSLITHSQPPFCTSNSFESLSSAEVLKIIGTTIFGISCNHSPITRIRKLLCGVAIGLSIYVIPTILGSIALQGIRGGGDKVFNIFTGDITAQSTTAGYIIIIIIGIFTALRKRTLLLLAILLAFATGIQTSNRSVLLFAVLVCIIESVISVKSKVSSGKHFQHLVKRRKLLLLFAALGMVTLTLVSESQFIYSRITAALDGRLGLYVRGYSRLFDYLLTPGNNLLEDAGNQFWWHSVPLDATRAGNLSGAYLSLGWLATFIIGIVLSLKKRKPGLYLLGFTLLFIYMTGMPLATGGYEFVGLYCGYLLLSNELLPMPRAKNIF